MTITITHAAIITTKLQTQIARLNTINVDGITYRISSNHHATQGTLAGKGGTLTIELSPIEADPENQPENEGDGPTVGPQEHEAGHRFCRRGHGPLRLGERSLQAILVGQT